VKNGSFIIEINHIQRDRNKMVSKNVTILSLLLPAATAFGTSIAIFFYKYSSLTLLYLYAGGGLLLSVYIVILRSEHRRCAK
jgi:hypothetical protein